MKKGLAISYFDLPHCAQIR